MVEFPTGDSDKGLGNGRTQYFLPLWLQKSWGSWITYGGGGYWINPGEGNKNWLQFGWQIQREINKTLPLGTELYYKSASTEAKMAKILQDILWVPLSTLLKTIISCFLQIRI